MLAFAIPALFTGISFYWLKLSDRFFLLHYQGKAEVGLYTVANSLAQPLFLVLMAFRMAWPQWHYAKLHEPEKHKHMVARSSTYFIALNGAVLVLLGTFLPLLVHVFLNRKFWSVGPVTFVLGLSIVLYALYFIFWVGANVAKRNRMIPVFFAIASAANIALNFWLIPQHGMWAAAWTTVAGYLILAVTVYFYSQKWYPIPYEWARLLKVLLATVLALGAAWGLGSALGLSVYAPLNELALDTLATAPAVLLFPLVLWATRFFTPGERQKLGGAARRLTGRPAAAVDVAGPAGALAAAAEPCDHACVDALSEDDLAAEDEELEMEQEADIDLTEGPTTTTIT
jgi:O-antigen/teichoic acid export membrane protein